MTLFAKVTPRTIEILTRMTGTKGPIKLVDHDTKIIEYDPAKQPRQANRRLNRIRPEPAIHLKDSKVRLLSRTPKTDEYLKVKGWGDESE